MSINRRELLKSLIGAPVAAMAATKAPTPQRDVYLRWGAEGPDVYRPAIGDVITVNYAVNYPFSGVITDEVEFDGQWPNPR